MSDRKQPSILISNETGYDDPLKISIAISDKAAEFELGKGMKKFFTGTGKVDVRVTLKQGAKLAGMFMPKSWTGTLATSPLAPNIILDIEDGESGDKLSVNFQESQSQSPIN
jgi:hypothetical protein